jgi:hypothetical protein
MGNHYHLLLRTEQANLSRGMRQLNGVYAQYFNRCHERVGHVFQGRFKAFLIKDEERLLTVARYVVLNPVRAGMVERPEDWKWSSYRAMVGLDKPKKFLNASHILCLFSNLKDEAIRLMCPTSRRALRHHRPSRVRVGVSFWGRKRRSGRSSRRLAGISTWKYPRGKD